mmetsp:Transcript_90297/g.254851  ORF Transcript_90297/g.254851 Transcript_90297/m.254851 type:complete len:390 (-) Transcript_90297:864-2033(-)
MGSVCLCWKCCSMEDRSYVLPLPLTMTGSRIMSNVIGQRRWLGNRLGPTGFCMYKSPTKAPSLSQLGAGACPKLFRRLLLEAGDPPPNDFRLTLATAAAALPTIATTPLADGVAAALMSSPIAVGAALGAAASSEFANVHWHTCATVGQSCNGRSFISCSNKFVNSTRRQVESTRKRRASKNSSAMWTSTSTRRCRSGTSTRCPLPSARPSRERRAPSLHGTKCPKMRARASNEAHSPLFAIHTDRSNANTLQARRLAVASAPAALATRSRTSSIESELKQATVSIVDRAAGSAGAPDAAGAAEEDVELVLDACEVGRSAAPSPSSAISPPIFRTEMDNCNGRSVYADNTTPSARGAAERSELRGIGVEPIQMERCAELLRRSMSAARS